MTFRHHLSTLMTWILLLGVVSVVSPAQAQAQAIKVAVVDFQVALENIEDGKKAQARLEAIFMGKQAEIEQMETNFMARQREYEAKASVLTDAARTDLERELAELQMQYQQFVMQAQQEMQVAETQVLNQLVEALRETAEAYGQDKGYTLILAKEAVVFSTGDDITDQVVQRYNATHSSG